MCSILKEGQAIGSYTVQLLIKANPYVETYRVTDASGNLFFLKLFVKAKMPSQLINKKTGQVSEIEYIQEIHSRSIVSYVASGEYEAPESSCPYYLTNFYNGSLLSDFISQVGQLDPDHALSLFEQILDGLQALHIHFPPLCHNDVTPSNIILLENTPGELRLIDLGHVSRDCSGSVPFDTSDLELLYLANETFAGIYDDKTDIFAATAVYYTMLTGHAPWSEAVLDAPTQAGKAELLAAYRKEHALDLDSLGVDEFTRIVLEKGLAVDPDERFESVAAVFKTLIGKKKPEPSGPKASSKKSHTKDEFDQKEDDQQELNVEVKQGKGNGFADIAGMEELKTYLREHVIFALKNKEIAERYRITPPNGMLLYGPPGCGKTFVAEKFAEETQCHFILVKASDLASTYIHGSQQKIGKLFAEAEKNAPTVLCFDEFDALVPDRSNDASQHYAGEVNEFLSQLNNCAARGIFVVATSNRPDKIDPAVLRTGRIDKLVYVPLPDETARKEMFLLHLKDRPLDEATLDVDKLAQMSKGYIASDISFVVNDTALICAYAGELISQEKLEATLRITKPSLRPDSAKVYETIKNKMEGVDRRNVATRTPIGFRMEE